MAVVDFVDGRGWRLRQLAALCAELGVNRADFVGNSMGGAMVLADAASADPVLPTRRGFPRDAEDSPMTGSARTLIDKPRQGDFSWRSG